jgi:SAM-dependent methyltransferase
MDERMDWDLVCPGCRRRSGDRLDVRTLERAGDVLACECGRRYPIVDGVPIVMADPASYVRADIAAIVERDLPVEVAALLAEDGPDDAPYPRLLEHVSIYMDAHWGDHAMPEVTFGGRALAERIAQLPHAKLAVDLGCSVGRFTAELARNCERVVGLDLSFGAVRRARRMLAGEPVAYARRVAGRSYLPARAQTSAIAAERYQLVCGDALDPPLLPGMFDRVVALNLLDAVKRPRLLVSVIDGLCAPGGEVILASPYAWQSHVMEEHERIVGPDPAGEIRRMFAAYEIVDDTEIPWVLRRDARTEVSYRIHYLRARKRGT